ncbi:MAG: hypothetical protein QG597_1539, partial [Actinomycetota bacterium]|nr:hypothetical protein [Actinomycetota bacterium]
NGVRPYSAPTPPTDTSVEPIFLGFFSVVIGLVFNAVWLDFDKAPL